MMRVVAGVALLLAVAVPAGAAHGGAHSGSVHGGGYHGGVHHGGFHHTGSHVFVGGGVFFDPFWFGYPYSYYPYPYAYYPYYPYYYPESPYYPPPPPEEESGAGSGPPEGGSMPAPRAATYGLVQLRGVPDGAAVDLDDRFWLTADSLDDRWLALPEGRHTLTVRPRDGARLERSVDVKPGTTVVVQFRSTRHA